MKRFFVGLAAVICALNVSFVTTVHAKENLVPNYELKFLIDSDQVLNSDYELNSEYRDYFNTGKKYNTVGVLYIETPEYDFPIKAGIIG